jgi:hypothetical protein
MAAKDPNEPLPVGTKVRWKQMPSSIAVVVSSSYGGKHNIKFETDGPLKGQIVPANRAALLEVTILDEIAIEGTDSPDPWFRKPPEPTGLEAEARAFIEAERKRKQSD